MQKLFYILFCVTLISCNSKTQEVKKEEVIVFSDNETTIYESDIYEVINAFFKNEKKTNILDGIDYNRKLLTVYPNSNYIHSEDLGELGFITEEDRNFIFQQVSYLDKYDLKQEHFTDFKLISIDTIKDTEDFYYITIPLFSKDKKTSILVFGNISRLNSFGKILIFSKENNNWIQTDKGQMWIHL